MFCLFVVLVVGLGWIAWEVLGYNGGIGLVGLLYQGLLLFMVEHVVLSLGVDIYC